MNKILKILLISLFFVFLFFLFHIKEKTISLFQSVNQELSYELNSSEIIELTNQERVSNKLSPLKENEILNKIAEKKIEDMSENQYFDHISPLNKKIDDLIQEYNYEYIGVGENLAMGNFKNEQEIVDGWMNSPGHRENILSFGFKEIGVAVKEIYYKEKKYWFSVQVFALPKSSCPAENIDLLNLIDVKKNELDEIMNEINEADKEIKKANKTKEKINNYNNLIEKHNTILKEIEALTNEYNEKINLINKCINDYGY